MAQRMSVGSLLLAPVIVIGTSRTEGPARFQQPRGGQGKPLTVREEEGNTLSDFAADYFEAMLDSGGFPVAESSGCSGRYPKQWDQPKWKAILARPDVDWAEFRMCAYGLGPPDDPSAFYQHLTRVVFKSHPALKMALSRRCPGISSSHKHVALKGSRPGSAVTRCTEAGVYCKQFVQVIAEVLQSTLVAAGGVSHLTLGRPCGSDDKAGGLTEDLEEDLGGDHNDQSAVVAHSSPDERVVESSPEPNSTLVVVSTEQNEGQELAALPRPAVSKKGEGSRGTMPVDAGHPDEQHPDRRAGQPVEGIEEVGGAWALLQPVPASYQPVGAILDPSASMLVDDGDDVGRLSEVGTPSAADDLTAWHEFRVNEFDEVIQAALLIQDENDDPNDHRLDMTVGLEPDRFYSQDYYLPDGRDYYREGRKHFVVYHVEPRKRFFLPFPNFGHECGLKPDRDLSGERMTMCKHAGPPPFGWITTSQYYDNFHNNEDADPDLGWWVGYTLLAKKGSRLSWEDEEQSDHGGDGHESDGHPEDDDEEWHEEEEEEEEPSTSTTSYGSSRSRSQRRAGGGTCSLSMLAQRYVEVINTLGTGTVQDWKRVLECGDALLTEAGGVEQAATALWEARGRNGLNNLEGVHNQSLDAILHPVLLEYVRSVEQNGMPARHPGSTERISAGLHPNAKVHLNQVYKQIYKDVKKHRVLVTTQQNPQLGATISSPFEAVDKMMPDRSIAPDKRVVHDQRRVNMMTDKTWHPPALQPTHQQIARRVLWHKTRYPGIEVVISKRDIAGAFRLLWVSPSDAHLFAGDLPWRPEMMEKEDGDTDSLQYEDVSPGKEFTVIYLVSSFGFSGSPGEWTAFGRATEEYHRAHMPGQPRRDGSSGFDSKILVDDMVLVEPVLGFRPWVSASCYDSGVRMLLGTNAVNEEKNAIEGAFREEQTIWGLNMNTHTELASLPARRIEKGAHLLALPAFDFDNKTLTLRQLQQFRGITTGWAVVVRGLKNELKAADLFLTAGDGGVPVKPRSLGYEDEDKAAVRAWEDLWALFETCRWLCARTEMWETQFCATLGELLEPKERLGLPGGHRQAVFVSADATPTTVGAIDWTNGAAARMSAVTVGPWLDEAMQGEKDQDKVRIHVSEMLAFVAFVAAQGEVWHGKIVVYAGDNQVVRSWIMRRQSGSRAGRLLLRVLAMCEMRYSFVVLAGWWRTFHNVDSDFITRCTDIEFEEYMTRKNWSKIDMGGYIETALHDTERFGPCFLSWKDPGDRQLIMQLKERRVKRAVDRPVGIKWQEIEVYEWAASDRIVKDFIAVAQSCNAAKPGTGSVRVGVGTVGCDVMGNQLIEFMNWLEKKDAALGLIEGPGLAGWDAASKWCTQRGWAEVKLEFLTTELGEALARRRIAFIASPTPLEKEVVESLLPRSVVATPLGTIVTQGRLHEGLCWEYPMKLELTFGAPREPLLPHVVAHAKWKENGTRENIHGLTGPGRWPLAERCKGCL